MEYNSNEAFIRGLISGRRRRDRDEFFETATRLGVSATFIKLSEPEASFDTIMAVIPDNKK